MEGSDERGMIKEPFLKNSMMKRASGFWAIPLILGKLPA